MAWNGVVRRTKSAYNSLIFCIPKKSGQGPRIVQDFRGLNKKTHTDQYSMKKVNECISDIEQANSTIFTTIDLTSGFWQMPIEELLCKAFGSSNGSPHRWVCWDVQPLFKVGWKRCWTKSRTSLSTLMMSSSSPPPTSIT